MITLQCKLNLAIYLVAHPIDSLRNRILFTLPINDNANRTNWRRHLKEDKVPHIQFPAVWSAPPLLPNPFEHGDNSKKLLVGIWFGTAPTRAIGIIYYTLFTSQYFFHHMHRNRFDLPSNNNAYARIAEGDS